MTLLQGASSIRETSLIGSSMLAKTLIKHSSTLLVPTASPRLNGEIFFVLTSPSIGSWFGSSLLYLSSMPLLSMENATLNGLRNGDTVKESHLLMDFWPTIRDGGFNVGNIKVASIRDPRVKLAHHCIATTITGRKETTHRVTEIDLYYLYCIYTPKGCWSLRLLGRLELLTGELRDALSIEPPPHVFKKKSLIAMGVIMELQNRICVWPAPKAVKEEEEAEEEAEGDEGHDGAGGSTSMHRNISQGDWQVRQARWMDQQDEQWGRLNTWMGQQDEQAH
ncbi:hypothetical protein Tco_0956848 [Tanacetum coccineum]